MVIKACCMSPFSSPESLSPDPDPGVGCSKLRKKILKLKLEGEKSSQKGHHNEALTAYSLAIKLAEDCNNAFDLLLTNRAAVYIKLKQYEYALKDANDFIARNPESWEGYAAKALALDGLNEKVSAEIAAALAFYHNRDIFSDVSPFKETFVTMQKRIFLCDSVDELQEAIFSQDTKKGELKILVLGSKEYNLNFYAVHEPWNNCVVVGTRKDCSVSVKSDNTISLLNCMLTNLSFFLNKGCVNCIPGSFVKILNCNFTSDNDTIPAVITEGEFSAEQCNFTSIHGSGLVCVGQCNAVAVECSFCNNEIAGVYVSQGATLLAKRCYIYGNCNGLDIEKEVSKCAAINCDIHHNCDMGILVLDSKNVTLIRNSIFGNDEGGIFIANSEVDIKENNIFDNGSWGIWSQSNSWCNILMNRVFRNSAGGVRVGFRATLFYPSVIEMNKIYDNTGPGFVENINEFEVYGNGKNDNLMMSFLKSRNSLTSAKFQDNEVYNNKEIETGGKLNLCVQYCSNCRKKCQPKTCEGCFTTAYCGKSCQKKHLSKHKRICNVLRKKSRYLITSIETVDHGIPHATSYPPRNGSRFIVKVHTVWTTVIFTIQLSDSTYCILTSDWNLMLYDRSHRLHKTFDSKFVKELVREYGVLCAQKSLEKKLFFHCLFEDNGQLRLFTNDFPEFQSW